MSRDVAIQVYSVRLQSQPPEAAMSIEAPTPRDAALAFSARVGPDEAAEIVVVSPDGTESVYGYRSAVPRAHLDD